MMYISILCEIGQPRSNDHPMRWARKWDFVYSFFVYDSIADVPIHIFKKRFRKWDVHLISDGANGKFDIPFHGFVKIVYDYL